MNCIYVGELSGCFISDLKIEVVRGVPFEAPEKWIAEKVKSDPTRWKQTDKAAPVITEEPVADRTVIDPSDGTEPDPMGKGPKSPRKSG